MSAANGQGKCSNRHQERALTPETKKRTIHLLQNRTNLLALNTPAASPPADGARTVAQDRSTVCTMTVDISHSPSYALRNERGIGAATRRTPAPDTIP